MSRSRKAEVQFADAIRTPVEALFKILPGGLLRAMLRWWRWSGGFVGFGVRYMCVRKLAKSCGRKVLIFPGCLLHWLEKTEFGENVSLHDFCYIDAVGGVKIGDNARIAHNCSLISGQHRYDQPGRTIFDSDYTMAPIVLEDDVWLGAGVVILQGVTVGRGSVIAANAVVTKDVEPYSIMGGVPAKLLKKRPGFDEGIEAGDPSAQADPSAADTTEQA
jgi:acetyltransferase-like isoleucine patch superfamily enzyme